MIHDIIQPLAPTGQELIHGWLSYGDVRAAMRSPFPVTAWEHPALRLFVMSAVEVATDTDKVSRGPEYHISISKQLQRGIPTRCSKEEGEFVLRVFGGLDGWEEDNHVPNGQVRNYWRAVAEPMIGRGCACKETETVIVEGDYEHRPLE